MKLITYISTLSVVLASFGAYSVEINNDIWTYKKENGELILNQVDENTTLFKIVTNENMHICEVEGDFRVIAENENHVTLQWYDENACQITAIMGRDASVIVTDECNNYCGLNAGRSMNGIYN